MIILLTENSPIGMLTLSSMRSVMLDCYPMGSYEDPLYEIQEYLNLCQKHTRRRRAMTSQSLPAHLDEHLVPVRVGTGTSPTDRYPDWHKQRWISLCNNTPWSDMVLSNPDLPPTITRPRHDRQRDTYKIKQSIYNICGWAPDAIINIYNGTPDLRWRDKLCALTDDDPDITIISLNALDPKFATNLEDTVHNLLDHHLSILAMQEPASDDDTERGLGSVLSLEVPFEMDDCADDPGTGKK